MKNIKRFIFSRIEDKVNKYKKIKEDKRTAKREKQTILQRNLFVELKKQQPPPTEEQPIEEQPIFSNVSNEELKTIKQIKKKYLVD
jgi:hypothetical protein